MSSEDQEVDYQNVEFLRPRDVTPDAVLRGAQTDLKEGDQVVVVVCRADGSYSTRLSGPATILPGAALKLLSISVSQVNGTLRSER